MSADRFEITEAGFNQLQITNEAGESIWINSAASMVSRFSAGAIRQQSADIAELRAELAAAVTRAEQAGQRLGNLLAVIHRDGGHYESEHGTEKACADAETAVHVLRGSLEGYVEANRYMKGELDDAIEDARKYAEANGEIVSLRAFAQSVMSAWPYGDVDGGDLQEMAITHGLIVRKDPAPTEPCGDGCECAGMVTAEEFAAGVECYRRTELLTGKSAALAQAAAVGK